MRACERLFGLLFFCCAVWLLGCDEHLAGTHEAEVTFTVKGHAPERTPTPSSSSHAKPQTLAEAAISPVLTRLATLHITADAEPVGDDKIKLTLDKDQVETAEDGLKWPGGIELDDLDAEFTMPLAQAGGLVEKTEVIDGKTVKFWEGARIDIAHAIGATKVPEGHKLVGQAYDSMRGRTRWIHTPSLAVLAGGVSSVSRINGGKGISIKLRPDTAAAMKEAADHTHGPVAIVRGTSVLVVQPITAATSSFDVSFGDDIYSYTRAHMTMKLLETPPVPPLERIEVKPLAPDWSVAIACIVIPIIMSIGWLVFVRRFDRAQPEPWWLVLATFALGGLSVIPAGFAEYFLMSASPYLNPDVMTLGGQFLGLLPGLFAFTLVVGVSEEGSKFLGAWTLARHRREFDEPVDGIVYGAASALGFAAIENIKYFAAGRLGGTLIVARAFMSVPGHMFFGAIWGYALGQKLVRKRTSVLLYFLFAAFCHGAFDTVLSIDGLQLLAMVIDGLLAILFVVLLRRALRHGAVTAGKDEAVPSAQRWLFTMGSAGLTVAYTIMISLVAIALFGIGIYYEVEHHRVGMSFVGISATMLLLIGLAANGLSQSIPLDAAVDVEGVTFAGATRKWARIAGIERVPAWNIFGPRGSVKLRSQDGDVLIGPGDPTTVERLIVSLNAAMKPKA